MGEFTYPLRWQDPTNARNGRALEDWLRDSGFDEINGSRIVTGTIEADKLQVDQLSAVAAKMGTVTVDESLTMVDGGIFATNDEPPRWILDIDEYGVQDFVFETGHVSEKVPGSLNAALTGTTGALYLDSPTMGDATDYGKGSVVVSANDAATYPQGFAKLGASGWGDFDAYLNVIATALGSGDADMTISCDAYGAGSAQIMITTSGVLLFSADNITLTNTHSGHLTTEVITANNEIQVGDGSKSDPSVGPKADADTGLYFPLADYMSVAAGGDQIVYFSQMGVNQAAGTRNAAGLMVDGLDAGTLGSTAGNNIILQAWRAGDGNNAELRLEFLRESAGSAWTTSAWGFRRITDSTSQASLWFYQSRIGVNLSGPSKTLHVAGSFAARPSTTTGTAWGSWVLISGSDYELCRYTSSARYKTNIKYKDIEAEYAAIELPPLAEFDMKEPREGEEGRHVAWIAEDLFLADPRLVSFDEEGRPETPDPMQIMQVMAAKINRLERLVGAGKGAG